MEEKDKYKFLVELGKGLDEMVENSTLMLTQKTQLMSKIESKLFNIEQE